MSIQSLTKPFVLIVGCGRSGTTLLRAMIDSHPSLAISREAGFIAPMASRQSRYESRAGFHTERFTQDLRATNALRALNMTLDNVLTALQTAKPSTYADAVRAVYRAYADARGKSMYGDKTPKYVLALEPLAKAFPDAKFIHLIRDGRDVALSFMNFATGPSTVPEAAAHWRRQVTAGLTAGAKLGPDRYHEIRFENLIKDPQAELTNLCSFIDVAFSPQMLEYHRRPRAELAVNPTKAVDRPPLPGTRNWRTEMSPSDRRKFEAIAGDLLERLRYERSVRISVTVSSIARLAAAGQVTRKRIRAAAKRLPRGSRNR